MRFIRDGYSCWHAVVDRPLCTQSYDTTREESELPVGAFACSMCVRAMVADYRPVQKVETLWARGANWTDPGTGEECFIAPTGSETCTCGKHISRHYGGTEYRCESR